MCYGINNRNNKGEEVWRSMKQRPESRRFCSASSAMSMRVGVGLVVGIRWGLGVFFGLAALGLTVLLAGCASGDSHSTAQSRDGDRSQVIVTMAPEAEPAAGFDPVYGWGDGEHVHEPLIQSTLITTNQDLEFVNDLATNYQASEDGLTWTFTIRDDVQFSDGEPLQASDVAFTLNIIRETPESSVDLSMVKEVQVLDNVTVEIDLAKPYNALLYTLAVVGIVPEHAYDAEYGAHPIGSGPYCLESWNRGQQVVLKANEHYYGDKPLMDRVVVLFMAEDASRAAAASGDVDLAYTSALLAQEPLEGYSLLNCSSVDSRGISLPTQPLGSPEKVGEGDQSYAVGNAVTSDLAIRQAMNYGLNREEVVEAVLGGYGTPAYSVSDGMPWISPAMVCSYDPDLANRLLDEAGWVRGEDGVRSRDGVRAELTLWYTAGDTVRQAFAYAFAESMKPLGIVVTPQGASFEDIYPHEFSDPVLWGWGSNSPSEFYNLYYSSGWGNFPCWNSETVDRWMNDALAQTSIETSYDYWQQAQWDGESGIAVQGAAPWVWIANVNHLYYQRDGLYVAPQKPHPHGHGWSILNNVDQWHWN